MENAKNQAVHKVHLNKKQRRQKQKAQSKEIPIEQIIAADTDIASATSLDHDIMTMLRLSLNSFFLTL